MTDDVRSFVLRAVEEPSMLPTSAARTAQMGAGPVARTVTGSALIVAPESELLSRLVTELVRFGYRPLIHIQDEIPTEEVPSVMLIAAPQGMREAVDHSDAVRGAESLRSVPVVWLLRPQDLGELRDHEGLVDDFLGLPWHADELEARLRLLQLRVGGEDDELLRRGPLSMNLATYQVSLEGRKLDLTFMEYELLRLFMTNPGRVYRREEILERVWGYDYFGGMRTVDVHVRRVRAKLGQDHAWLVETVRSVGYRMATLRP
jgi:DNA-binding response OmpR family regulator